MNKKLTKYEIIIANLEKASADLKKANEEISCVFSEIC